MPVKDFDKFEFKHGRIKQGCNSVKRARKIKLEPKTFKRELESTEVQLMNRLTNKEFNNHWLKDADLSKIMPD